MASQPADGRARRTPTPGRSARREPLRVEERRGWLSHGLAALAISALGLAAAGSVSLTTSAQPIAAPAPATTTCRPARPSSPVRRPAEQLRSPARPRGRQDRRACRQTAAWPPSPDPGRRGHSRTVQLQAAVVKERAAQRAEDLAKSAEQVSQAARDAGGAARSQELASTERATREAAVKLAQQRLAEAIRKRVAAETERQGVESATTTTARPTTTDPRPPGVDPTTIVPAGGGSASPVPGAVIGAHFGQYGSWSRYHTGLDFRAGYRDADQGRRRRCRGLRRQQR